jgi:RNA polymerase sigma-70 factor (ECF subfamily)
LTAEEERRSAELMRRAISGDQIAYADLLVLLTTAARRYVRGKAGDVPWIDDAVQETLLSIHAARQTYDPGRPFAPWFYAIVTHRLIDVLRRERRIHAREVTTDPLPVQPSPHGRDEPGIDVDAIHAALSTLPSRQREIVEAMKFRDESVRSVSGRLGMSESAVKVTAHRGYQALRRLLGGRNETRRD